MEKKEYFHSLTSLRGIAALWVAIGHISWTLPSAALVSIFPMIRQGYLAVDFFFILSGFVLAHAYKLFDMKSVREYMAFSKARIERIFPIHIILLLIFGIVFYIFEKNNIVLPGLYELKAFLAQLFLIHILPFFNSNYDVGTSYFFSWNYPAWTLALEVWWFIIVTGIFVLWNKFLKLDALKRSVYLWIVIVLAGSLAGILFFTKSSIFIDAPNFTNSLIRSGIDFIAGLFLYKMFTLGKFKFNNWEAALLYILTLLGIILWLLPTARYFNIAFWIILIPFIIAASLDEETTIHKVLVLPPLVYLGNISYSLYLIHGPIERVIAALYPRSSGSLAITIGYYAIFILTTIIFASLTYAYIEKPFIAYFKRRRANS